MRYFFALQMFSLPAGFVVVGVIVVVVAGFGGVKIK